MFSSSETNKPIYYLSYLTYYLINQLINDLAYQLPT
jgi:hypothetical protein